MAEDRCVANLARFRSAVVPGDVSPAERRRLGRCLLKSSDSTGALTLIFGMMIFVGQPAGSLTFIARRFFFSVRNASSWPRCGCPFLVRRHATNSGRRCLPQGRRR